jgi:adenylate kinase family enzyme
MEPQVDLGPRIIITGRPGSGKTSLGLELGSLLRRRVFMLDTLVTDERLRRRPPEEIAYAMNNVARGEEWILEGFPEDVPQHAWNTATAVIWLDFSRTVTAWHVFKRSFPRRLARRRVWGLIRYTLLSDAAARAHQKQYVDGFTPPDAILLRLSSPKDRRTLMRSATEAGAIPVDCYRSDPPRIGPSKPETAE